MSNFALGDVVTIVTHPFNMATNNVMISGEYQMIPPLVIVVEVFEDGLDLLDIKYKCMWFSTKENLIKESYFQENELKSTTLAKDADLPKFKINDIVALRTLSAELGKKRSFYNTEINKHTTKKSSSETGLLTFISPVMYIVAVDKFDSSKDTKTSPKIKFKKVYPEFVAKCKWFNSVSEKFSECWIPLEALIVIPQVSIELLKKVQKAIDSGKCLRTDTILVNPHQISNRSGYYFLDSFDHISQQNSNLPLETFEDSKIIKNPIKSIAPLFKTTSLKKKQYLKLSLSVQKLIEKAILQGAKNYITIKYRDNLDTFTSRTISKFKIIDGQSDKPGESKIVKYVSAYCHLRGAERNFRLDAILEAKELALKF
jgi:uncharacterized protein YodC (DUF2158 family)